MDKERPSVSVGGIVTEVSAAVWLSLAISTDNVYAGAIGVAAAAFPIVYDFGVQLNADRAIRLQNIENQNSENDRKE